MKQDFLRLGDRSQPAYRHLFDRACVLKERRRAHMVDMTLVGRTLALVFEKASTRTRVSFEAAMFQLGGSAVSLPVGESQLGRGETAADTARVLSRYVDAVVVRTYGDDRLAEFARVSTVPVINGLSDGSHPVQLLADLFTIEERLGTVRDKVVTFVGDGKSNMARSWAEAAQLFAFELRIAAPHDYRLADAAHVHFHDDAALAVRGAHVIATDVWTSMGQESEAAKRREELARFTVDGALVAKARPGCIVLHCLPAHRGEEITDEVIESSAIFDEAENRLHVQKALLEEILLP